MEHPKPAKISLIGFYLRNLAANLFGNLIIAVLNFFSPLAVYEDWRNFLMGGGWTAIPIIFVCIVSLGVLLQYILQRPLAALLEKIHLGQEPDTKLQANARRRLLNLPVVLALVNLSMWVALSLVFLPIMDILIDMSLPSFFFALFRLIMVGLIISFISFFLIDDYSRKTLVPIFFPDGKLAALPGGIKISILRRIRVLMGAGTNMPMVLLVGTLAFAVWELQDSAASASQFGTEFLIFAIALGITFVVVAICLNFLVGKSILSPIKDMMRLVYQVRNGDFHQKVKVLSNDELGVLGDGMNEMTEGLIERDRMRQSLFLAKEVQQALLPRMDPQISGLDIASTSVYCDETGGDYFDYLIPDGQDSGKISLVIGDVSGHGVSAALLMATARAFLRQRSDLPGSISKIVSDVNCQLTRDVAESGGFITMFYLTIDAKNRELSWIRAGHDPAILYDPANDSFQELHGTGVALGVQADARFEANSKNDLQNRQIIFLGTDGIWEARNPQDEMFGKEKIQRIIRRHHQAGAKEIVTICFDTLSRFLEDHAPDDDVTMIVIKLIDD